MKCQVLFNSTGSESFTQY